MNRRIINGILLGIVVGSIIHICLSLIGLNAFSFIITEDHKWSGDWLALAVLFTEFVLTPYLGLRAVKKYEAKRLGIWGTLFFPFLSLIVILLIFIVGLIILLLKKPLAIAIGIILLIALLMGAFEEGVKIWIIFFD